MTTDMHGGSDSYPQGNNGGASRPSRATSRPSRSGAPSRQSGQRLTNNIKSPNGSSSGHRSTARRATTRPASSRPSAQRPAASGHQRTARQAGAQRRVASAGAAQTQRNAARQGAPHRYQPKGTYHGTPARSKRGLSFGAGSLGNLRSLPTPMIAGACIAALLVVLLIHHLLRLGVTINGEKKTVWTGTTIEKVLDAKLASPKPGNLMAVDGSLIEEGGGDRCAATINGETAYLDTKIPRGADVVIGDGADKTEDADVTEETIPHGTSDANRDLDGYFAGSIHVISEGKDGKLQRSKGKVSGKEVTEVLEQAEDAGYSVYTAKPDDKVICLTFDDGPWPETTEQILDVLQENGAKATFFTIGQQIAEHTASVKRAAEMGCQICTHSWDHAAGSGQGVNLTYMSADEQTNEIKKGYQAIADVLGSEPSHVTRCPGGNFYGPMIDTLAPLIDAEIGWDLDTEDWSQPGVEHIVEVLLSAQPGQVILMHDGGGDRSQTVEALKQALPKLVEQGFKFITLDEMLAYGKPSTAVNADPNAASSTSTDTTSTTTTSDTTATSGTTGTTDATGTTTSTGTTDATGTTTTTDTTATTGTTATGTTDVDASSTSDVSATDTTGTTATTTDTSTGIGITTTSDGAVNVG